MSQFQQNRLFMGNEKRFYQELNNVKKQIQKQKDCDLISGAEKERTEKMQNGSKNFMKKLKKFEIKGYHIKFHNRKAPGRDGVQGF